jgi:uncharacterized protein
MDRMAELIVKGRWIIILSFLALTGAMATQLPKIEFDPDVKSSLPADMPSRVSLDRIEDLFGGTDMVLMVIEADDVLAKDTLSRVKALSAGVERMPGVDRVMSLFTMKDIHGEFGDMYVDPAVEKIPKNERQLKELRARIKGNDMVYGSLVSEDFSATAIIALLKLDAQDLEVKQGLIKLTEDNPGPGKIHLAGLPVVRTNISRDMRQDMSRFMPMAILVLLVFLFLCFKQLRGVLLPFGVVVMSVIMVMGLLPLIGWKIQILTILLPIIMVAIANDYGIHMIARYQEKNRAGSGMTSKDLAKDVFKSMGKPILITAVTTMAGLLCLTSHIIISAQQLGILAAIGIGFALLASLLLIPAILAVLPMAKPLRQLNDGKNRGLIERLLNKNASMVNHRPWTVVLVLVGFVAAMGTGIGLIQVDTNSINYYDAGNPLVVAANLVDEKLGGSTSMAVVAEGNIKDPAVLREIDELEQALLALPEVDQTTSIAKVVRQMNMALNDEDPEFDRIPDSIEAVAELFLLYSFSGDPEDFDRLVDFPYEHALLTARINSPATKATSAVVNFTRDYVAERPDSRLVEVGGFAVLFSDLVDAVVRGQIISLLLSLLLVGLFVGILFKSFVAAGLSVIPIAISIILLFGLMGHLGMELNMISAMLSSIMIGVGVDYTIHFLWRYREERFKGMDARAAIRETLTTTGRGILFNAASVVVGFTLLLMSNFLPVRFFGVLVMVTISACLIGALMLLPGLVLIIRPRFLEPKSLGGKK